MAKKPTEAELQKQEEANKAYMRSFLNSSDPKKREAALTAIFRKSEKYGCSAEQTLAMIYEDDTQS